MERGTESGADTDETTRRRSRSGGPTRENSRSGTSGAGSPGTTTRGCPGSARSGCSARRTPRTSGRRSPVPWLTRLTDYPGTSGIVALNRDSVRLSLRSLFLIMKRLLDPSSLRALARGCAVLGAGGGGDTCIGLLQALQATEDFGPVPLVDLDELPDDELIMPCGGIGAPTVSIEKIENGDEGDRLREHLEDAHRAQGRGAHGRRDRRRERAAARSRGRRGSACRSWTPTAWAAPFPRCPRSPCTWPGSRRARA